MQTLSARDRVIAPRLSRPGAEVHHYRQRLAAGGGEARLPTGRHGPTLRCGVRGAGRREASQTRIQVVACRARLTSKRQ